MTLAFCLNFASLISSLSPRYGIDPQIVHKVMFAESGCRAGVKPSSSGCIGLMQICRGELTTGKHVYTDAQLRRPRLNIRLGIKRLAYAQKKCGQNPIDYLSNYAGLKCGPSHYSMLVLYGRHGVYDSELSGPPREDGYTRHPMLKE